MSGSFGRLLTIHLMLLVAGRSIEACTLSNVRSQTRPPTFQRWKLKPNANDLVEPVATERRNKIMMDGGMMAGGMMLGMGIVWLLVIVVLVLAIIALVKYLRT
ncbi:hypothetical protein [Roseovarius indicus]|uniref:hypothetical protein n=1 Tax=Roseovarius indicus TaxID=540747 RepID=UPI0010FD08D8|nr:hypothetical protein [Roseovarius indicus]